MNDTAENDAPAEPKYVLFQIGEGWSALYVDGRLDRLGDSYNVTERIEALLGVVSQESEVMDAIQHRDEAPSTLAELRAMEAERRKLRDEAEALRQQAADLIAQAEGLTATRVIPPGSTELD